MNSLGFVVEKVLGKGSYGHVYKALRKSDNNIYAVKVIDLNKLSRREIEDSINEIRLMASFTSPFLIRFYEAFCEKKRLFIVTEYAKLGDLSNLIERRRKKNRPLPETTIWRFLIQLLEGLRVLHSCGVVHRDLKSANILLSAPDLIKIGDLGISTVLHNTQLAKTQIGTPMYIAPEVWKKRPYDQKCDIWSLGILLYEMMTFKFPFNGRTTDELALCIFRGKYVLPTGYSSDLICILRQMLQLDPHQRPSVAELLEFPSVKARLDMILPTLSKDVITKFQSPHLLSTIKVPLNVNCVNLPNPSYGKQNDIVKPIDQRIHVKDSAQFNPRDITQISTPELKNIADQDLWSPIKLNLKKPRIRNSEPRFNSISQIGESYDEKKKANSNPEFQLKPHLEQPILDGIQKKINKSPKEAECINNHDKKNLNMNMNNKNENKKVVELNPVIPPHQCYKKVKQLQQRKSYDQRPAFMKPLFQPAPIKDKNYIISPRRYFANAQACHEPIPSHVHYPKLPPFQQAPVEDQIFNRPNFIEQPRKQPPVAINPRLRNIGV